jgi:hypothetical protein
MIVDNVGLKISLLETSSSMITLNVCVCFICYNNNNNYYYYYDYYQKKLGARDNFMVQNANNPSIM